MTATDGVLGAAVIEQIQRLGGQVPRGRALELEVVDTPAGQRLLPSWLRVLMSVTWPVELCTSDEFGWDLTFRAAQTDPASVSEPRPHAWLTCATDSGNYRYLTDLDAPCGAGPADPLLYRVDEEDQQPLWDSMRLSQLLSSLEPGVSAESGTVLAGVCWIGRHPDDEAVVHIPRSPVAVAGPGVQADPAGSRSAGLCPVTDLDQWRRQRPARPRAANPLTVVPRAPRERSDR
ncbi:hypothetical protein ACFVUW_10535 [Streptomyces xiamenensis]|uniref:hypothetical protein n=1 Tax=Streptomyces xiamenensis TaxID=408015 RepID=UPI0036EE1D18